MIMGNWNKVCSLECCDWPRASWAGQTMGEYIAKSGRVYEFFANQLR